MNTQTPNSIGSGSVHVKPLQPVINEVTMLGRANELLNHIATAERHVDTIFGVLFPRAVSSTPPANQDFPGTIDGTLADAATRVASLCGELATIKTRLGCSPE